MNVLRVDGNCFSISLGMDFCICFVDGLMGDYIVKVVSNVYGCGFCWSDIDTPSMYLVVS